MQRWLQVDRRHAHRQGGRAQRLVGPTASVLARVGEPEPSDSILRRRRVGTGGVGSK